MLINTAIPTAVVKYTPIIVSASDSTIHDINDIKNALSCDFIGFTPF